MDRKNCSLTVAEAAALLGVSKNRVGTFIRDKRLRARRFGAKNYMIERAEVERFGRIPRRAGRPARKKGKTQ
jgi:excisionase family DNA binding protein